MNKLEVLKLKKKLLTSALITTTTLEALNLGKVNAYAMKCEMDQAPIYYDITDGETPEAVEDLINHYCGVYGLDYEKVYDIIYNLTNGFDNYAWYTFNHIDGQIYESKESAIIAITNDIYKNPTNYGFENRSEVEGEIFEDDLSFEQLVEKHANLQYINKVIPATIGHVECGSDMDSDLYENHNNCGGFKAKSGKWMTFPSKEAGVIFLVNLLKDSYGCTIDSDKSFLNRIASKYCEIPDHWISLALPIYNNIESDFYYYTSENEYDRRSLDRILSLD